MSASGSPVIFGEVLFDCFPDHQRVLGGAPFNVAWHLQALGDQPCMISRVGDDKYGEQIRLAMQTANLDDHLLQQDNKHATGNVQISFNHNEPSYTITTDCAYDFIQPLSLDPNNAYRLLYHGSLALRQATSRQTLEQLRDNSQLPVFLDVNLRSPWWDSHYIHELIHHATWLKLNSDELHQLYGPGNPEDLLEHCLNSNSLAFILLTQGEQGALLLDSNGQKTHVSPAPADQVIDTVGAGDAFTAMLLHGLLNEWTIEDSMQQAQRFASAIVGCQGAIPTEPGFYQRFQR